MVVPQKEKTLPFRPAIALHYLLGMYMSRPSVFKKKKKKKLVGQKTSQTKI